MCKLSKKKTSIIISAVYLLPIFFLYSVIVLVPANTLSVQITSEKSTFNFEQITASKNEFITNKKLQKENYSSSQDIASGIKFEESNVDGPTSKKSKLPSRISLPFVLSKVANKPVNRSATNLSLIVNANRKQRNVSTAEPTNKINTLLNYSTENTTSYVNEEVRNTENNTKLPIKSEITSYINFNNTEQLTSKLNIARQNYGLPFFLRPRPVRPISQFYSKGKGTHRRPGGLVNIARDKKVTVCHDKAKCIDTHFGQANEVDKKTTVKESENTECPDKAKCVDTNFGSNEEKTTKNSQNTECPDKAKCVDTNFGSNEEKTTKKSENTECPDKAKCVDTNFGSNEGTTTKKSDNTQCHDKSKCVDTPFEQSNEKLNGKGKRTTKKKRKYKM